MKVCIETADEDLAALEKDYEEVGIETAEGMVLSTCSECVGVDLGLLC